MRLDGLTKAAAHVADAAPKLQELRKAGEGIEAMFVRQLLGEMQKSTKLFGEGQAGSVYGDLFNEALAKQIANRGAFGIADMMVKQAAPRILAEVAKRSATPLPVDRGQAELGPKSEIKNLQPEITSKSEIRNLQSEIGLSPPPNPLPLKTMALQGEGEPEHILTPTSTELSTDKRQS